MAAPGQAARLSPPAPVREEAKSNARLFCLHKPHCNFYRMVTPKLKPQEKLLGYKSVIN